MLYSVHMAVDTAMYKQRLEEDLAALTEELKSIGIHNPDVPSDWQAVPPAAGSSTADPNEVADRVEDWNERRGELAELETRYNNLTRALKKIEDGTFGICEINGEEIEADRLDANPAARTCKAHLNDEVDLPRS